MKAHIKATGHSWCHCGGPAFTGGLSKHRPGTRCCEQNPYGHIHLAARYGATEEELTEMMLEVILSMPGKATTSPIAPF